MYRIIKRIEVSGAHHLTLPYESKCSRLHGHNWIIEVTLENETLNESGMLVDFGEIKRIVYQLDHANINEVMPGINPTAENIAKWLCDQIPYCVKVSVQETANNIAIYEKDR